MRWHFRDEEKYHLLFLPWLFYFYVPQGVDTSGEYPSQHSLAAQYLRKRRHGLDELTITYLEAARREPLAFWQVENVERGKGLHLKDLATGRTVVAVDIAASETLNRFDIILAQVMHAAGIHTLNAMAPYALQPARFRERIMEILENFAKARSMEPVAWLDLDIDFLSLYHEFVEELFHPPKPMLANTSGDPMLWTTTRYTFDAAQRQDVLGKLRRMPDVEANSDDASCNGFRWAGQSTMMEKISRGQITVGADDVTITTNSMARDREFRMLLERELGERVRHADTKHETVDLESSGDGGPPPEAFDINSLPEEAQHQLRERIQQLCIRWADQKVPALGGITPREAVKTPEGRAKVIGLVNDWEHMMARGPKQQIEFDFETLRRELGLLESPPR
jgi:hypothetical protein